ncbi:hypothetical protein [Streptomyces misionensis]|uniref:hypothetical protein n=1 Tax=Streptomyces misionensis TaxID=67331 RepID=UPI0033B3457B
MGDVQALPPQLPQHLLRDPEFVRALRDRDFATVFTSAHRHGISYRRISEACALKPDRVSLIAQGKWAVTALATVERIADGLRIPGALLGLAARPWEDSLPMSLPEFDDGDDDMIRRQLLRGALAAGLTGSVLTALTHTRQSLDVALSANSTPPELTDLEAAAETYSYGYGGQPPGRVLADLVADFAGLGALLDSPQPIGTRVRVCRTAGQLGGMVAIVLHDLGARAEARGWFATAARAAQESGDTQLHAWVLAREAMVSINYGAPRAAAALAEQARRLAGKRPTAAATLSAAVAARAYALSHQPDEARQALAAADACMERLDAGERADTWLTHGEQKHHVHLSHALTALGDTQRAQESQQRALELSAPTSTMTRSLLRIDAAACAHHDGNTQEACQQAVAVLAELPMAYRTGLVHRRALDLYRSIPAQHHDERAARDFAEVLSA